MNEEFIELDDKSRILKSPKLKALYALLPKVALSKKDLGIAINKLKDELEAKVKEDSKKHSSSKLKSIDVTAPFDVNASSTRFY
ncbi:MAG: hypothetical protein H6799_03405 [Candidatus Nomurabacteria bacterium]|nr:MAG: hypothetical protein H6799_03405 [Candidatus Nomurabacteria bacterium]